MNNEQVSTLAEEAETLKMLQQFGQACYDKGCKQTLIAALVGALVVPASVFACYKLKKLNDQEKNKSES